MKKILLISILITLIIVSCGVPQADYDKLSEENKKLILKNKKLTQKITECQLTPSQILEQAEEYYDELNYIKSKDRLTVLIDKYPRSKEARKGKSLLKKVKKEILETEKALEKDKLKEDNDEAYKKALSKMKKKYDVTKEITWYSDKSSTKLNNQNFIYTYVGKKEKRKPWLGLTINYFTKKEWLFIQRMEVDVDGKIFEIEENSPGEFKSKEESGGKREWLDRIIKDFDMPMIKAIASAKVVKISFFGKDDVDKRTISSSEKKAIKNVLMTYEALRSIK
ncbi:hypothetical protein [Aquimarina longa]|uniref:hypothetical protein n=1 Tax=Aquimarina longa TaxID=1080221 RepID=UPI0007858AEE|nr:hypothetical protein [Aquimarina longa]